MLILSFLFLIMKNILMDFLYLLECLLLFIKLLICNFIILFFISLKDFDLVCEFGKNIYKFWERNSLYSFFIHYIKYYKHGKKISEEFLPFLRIFWILLIIVFMSLLKGFIKQDFKEFLSCFSLFLICFKLVKVFYSLEISLNLWEDLDRLFYRFNFPGRYIFPKRKDRFLDTGSFWLNLLRYFKYFQGKIVFNITIIIKDFLKDPSYIIRTSWRFFFSRSKLYRKLSKYYIFLMQELNSKIDWYRLLFRIYKIFRNRFLYPIYKRLVWPFVWLWLYFNL